MTKEKHQTAAAADRRSGSSPRMPARNFLIELILNSLIRNLA